MFFTRIQLNRFSAASLSPLGLRVCDPIVYPRGYDCLHIAFSQAGQRRVTFGGNLCCFGQERCLGRISTWAPLSWAIAKNTSSVTGHGQSALSTEDMRLN